MSGALRDRPEPEEPIDDLRRGVVLVVTRLDRLSRLAGEPLGTAERTRGKDAEFQSRDEPWADATSPAGRMILTVFAGIAGFERDRVHGRTEDGDGAPTRHRRRRRPR